MARPVTHEMQQLSMKLHTQYNRYFRNDQIVFKTYIFRNERVDFLVHGWPPIVEITYSGQ